MKLRLLAALTALSVNATAGFAADLALKARPVAAAPVAYSWSGCYVGAQAGYAFNGQSDQSSFFDLPGIGSRIFTNSETASGVMAGGQVGCNYQFSNFVVGSETEIWYQDLKGTTAPIAIQAPGEFRTQTFSNHFVTASSARVGYAFDRLLVFGKAGAAFATFKHSAVIGLLGAPPFDTHTAGDNVSVGLLLGGGLEYAITNQLSIKGEYDYIDFGTVNHSLTINQDVGTPIASVVRGTTNTHEREQLVKIGLNYRLF